jgi:hypothetical protein
MQPVSRANGHDDIPDCWPPTPQPKPTTYVESMWVVNARLAPKRHRVVVGLLCVLIAIAASILAVSWLNYREAVRYRELEQWRLK